MKHNKHSLSRRTFVKGVVASGAMLYGINLNASTDTVKKRKKTEELSGTVFHLTIDKTLVNVTGEPSYATAVNAMLQGPTLKWREGDTVTLHVTNNLQESSSIHWHGIILPYQMDGVPGISYEGIAPGETFTYTFTVNQSGTFWYHSHSAFQEQTGVYGAIVIEPKEKDPYEYDRDYVVLLSDYSDEKPATIYRKLKLFPDYYNFNRRTVGDFFSEVKTKGFLEAFKARQMWNKMRMSDRDLSDVTAYTYTFLMNGQNPATRFRALFQNGDKVRLRFINAAAMTFFDVRIPGLKMKVVAADGNNIQPVDVDEFRIGVAETYDVIVEPEDDKAYAIFAQSIARKGYALGNLSTDADILAEVPQMDPPQALTMLDMGMRKDMAQMKSMDMSKGDSMSSLKKPIPLTKLPIRWGVGTTMRAMNPQYRLDDPGVGLRNNGRKVLTYADLRSLRSTKEDRYPDREIVLHLTGNMERYMWSINGIPYHEAAPLEFHYGERLRITYINDTMMNHPMHLHGLWSDLETGDENHLVRKHTIISQPGSKISFRVTVDAKGAWAYHCHLLYHMTDMFRKVVVA
ncbi:copper resistance system multicopper oxidase [Sulfurimonas sediminis]|uniref:Copper resistance system multicopper oxidase n=1 Tax=Sulfurimonas sediminis TaxID=2590020 RepID=A0A7M1B779_9BACT|nr:copper resistance system multicopper oxidase [Sulfurimonas sediminis]QOP44562.1 copper resistance system multicopper oxidase [Sulfurimonas sediminis]